MRDPQDALAEDLSASSRRLDMGPTLSPYGSRTAINSYRDGKQEIYVDGRYWAMSSVSRPAPDGSSPVLAPDGARIAFDSRTQR